MYFNDLCTILILNISQRRRASPLVNALSQTYQRYHSTVNLLFESYSKLLNLQNRVSRCGCHWVSSPFLSPLYLQLRPVRWRAIIAGQLSTEAHATTSS